MKFQLVVMDKRNFILNHINYNASDLERMLETIRVLSMTDKPSKFEITRWNDRGERI